MKLFLIAEQVMIGCVTVYFWFSSSDNLFKLFKRKKTETNFFFWPYIIGFIAFPYVVAFCYKVSWDYIEDNKLRSAIYLSSIPLIIFLMGRYLYTLVKR